jgi:predicted enzyme related to lactoylglutathione lyase
MASGTQLVTLIPITKMDRAIGFYTKVLGGKLTMRAEGPMRNFWASLSLGGCEVWLVNPGEKERRKLAYNTLVVKDIRKFVASLKARKVKFGKAERMGPSTKVEGPVAYDEMGASAFFKDSEGNLLMLWQNGAGM